ncbi:uncharacterized protein [Prorops nasuta]|uniref:uncharacterized protein n=1 Tax=Prorops nasuta TaxID=863751 RepID=UPI0034CF266B
MSSYPKGKKSSSHRSSRPRKRRFHGNRYTNGPADDEECNTSSSEQKLSTASTENIIVYPWHCYRIIEFLTVFHAISDMVICRSCKQSITFAESGYRGLGFKIVLTCRCGRREINSGPLINTGFEINRRIVFVMRLLGVGREGINVFCGLMDICKGLTKSTYDQIVQHIYSASKSMFESVCEKAVKEEQEKNVENGRSENCLKVSGDGSWKKRGFSSLFGVTTLIGYYSGKIVDLIVKSAYCHSCTPKKSTLDSNEIQGCYEGHEESCSSNHEGSTGKMEVDSIIEMFMRSTEKFRVKYTNYIGDGDSKTFADILKINPYGDDCPVTKNECMEHVEKRMDSLLRNKIQREKLGGESGLAESVIKKLTTYYGLAIRENINSLEDMRKAVMATLDHYCSTDINLRHENCPSGAESWCDWRKAEATNSLESFKHPARLIDENVEEHIRPIYEELSNDELLTRFLGGHTQNSNKSFNSTVWLISPKQMNSGHKIIEIAAYIAAGMFNDGYSSILSTMQLLDLKIGQLCKMFADNVDAQRIGRENRRASFSSKKARTASRLEQLHQNEFHEEAEGLLYGAGIAN